MRGNLFCVHAARSISGLGMDRHREDVEEMLANLESVLTQRHIILIRTSLSGIVDYELRKRTVFVIGATTDQPLCVLGVQHRGILMGNALLRELPMTFTCARNAGRSFRPVLNCGEYDAIRVLYCENELAIIVDAGRLLEGLVR